MSQYFWSGVTSTSKSVAGNYVNSDAITVSSVVPGANDVVKLGMTVSIINAPSTGLSAATWWMYSGGGTIPANGFLGKISLDAGTSFFYSSTSSSVASSDKVISGTNNLGVSGGYVEPDPTYYLDSGPGYGASGVVNGTATLPDQDVVIFNSPDFGVAGNGSAGQYIAPEPAYYLSDGPGFGASGVESGTAFMPSPSIVIYPETYGVGGNGSTGNYKEINPAYYLTSGPGYGDDDGSLSQGSATTPSTEFVATDAGTYGANGTELTGEIELSELVNKDDVVDGIYVLVGHDNYPGGDAGTETGSAAQLIADKAAVDAGKTDIKNTRTILTITGVFDAPAAAAAAAAAQNTTDKNQVNGNVSKIQLGQTVLAGTNPGLYNPDTNEGVVPVNEDEFVRLNPDGTLRGCAQTVGPTMDEYLGGL